MLKYILCAAALCLSVNTYANDRDLWLKVTAVDAVMTESQGHFDEEMRAPLLESARVILNSELEKYPEVNSENSKVYVVVSLDDCVYDIAVVGVDTSTARTDVTFIDLAERN